MDVKKICYLLLIFICLLFSWKLLTLPMIRIVVVEKTLLYFNANGNINEKVNGESMSQPDKVPPGLDVNVLQKIESKPVRNFSIDYRSNTFLKDGIPFQYISGSIHYSRLPRIYWEDRLRKIKGAGLDAVQVYVAWNFHEEEEGHFNFNGDRDIVAFLSLANKIGLLVILRPGPYICAEWDFGGLPAWLLRKNATMVIRSSDRQFTSAVQNWYNVLLPRIRPLLYQNGGPVVMVQVENEYGSYYTCDRVYLAFLHDLTRHHLGKDVILFTTDGNSAGYLKCGALDRRNFVTVDFGLTNDVKGAFRDLRKIQPTGPLVNSEFYVGWLDSWGHPHSRVGAQAAANSLRTLVNYSVSVNVNMYMFFGGSNFAYWNGANSPPYLPQPTSYDYDAPLSEAGDLTPKFYALQQIIVKHKKITPPAYPGNSTKKAYGRVTMSKAGSIFSRIGMASGQVKSRYPLTMEAIRQYQGYAVYTVSIRGWPSGQLSLNLTRVGDVGYVFAASNQQSANLTFFGTVSRTAPYLTFTKPSSAAYLHILVENQGHVNYGRQMFNDVKGIIGNVTLGGRLLSDWLITPLNLSQPNVNFSGSSFPPQGSIHEGTFTVILSAQDTFLNMTQFSKGQVHINGVNLGRYWPAKGPQITLYVPRSFLKFGTNRISVFEVVGTVGCHPGSCSVNLVDKPKLDAPIRGFQEKLAFRGHEVH